MCCLRLLLRTSFSAGRGLRSWCTSAGALLALGLNSRSSLGIHNHAQRWFYNGSALRARPALRCLGALAASLCLTMCAFWNVPGVKLRAKTAAARRMTVADRCVTSSRGLASKSIALTFPLAKSGNVKNQLLRQANSRLRDALFAHADGAAAARRVAGLVRERAEARKDTPRVGLKFGG